MSKTTAPATEYEFYQLPSGGPRQGYFRELPQVESEEKRDTYEAPVSGVPAIATLSASTPLMPQASMPTPLSIEAQEQAVLTELFRLRPRLPASEITIGEFIARGAFGEVFSGQMSGVPIALKKVSYSARQIKAITLESFAESSAWEISRLSTLNHPNLVTFYGIHQEKNGFYFLVMELCALKSLRFQLDTRDTPFTHSQRWEIAVGIARGLAYLHHHGTIHRDLKSDNILMATATHPKIGDLGVAQADIMTEEKEAQVVAEGKSDFRFKAPEDFVGDSSRSSAASDIFAFGLILWELFTGEQPSRLRAEEIRTRLRTHGEREPIPINPRHCPPAFAELMRDCWQENPSARPSAEKIVQYLLEIASTFHSQPAATILHQTNQLLLHEGLPTLKDYRPPLTQTAPLDESADDFWMRQEKKQPAMTESKGEAKEANVVEEKLTSLNEEILAFLDDLDERVLVVVGEGGTGKTTAIEHLVYQLCTAPTSIETKNSSSSSSPSQVPRVQAPPPPNQSKGWYARSLSRRYPAATHPAPASAKVEKPKWLPILLRQNLPVWQHSQLNNGISKALASETYRLNDFEKNLKTQFVLVIVDAWDELKFDSPDAEEINLPTQLGMGQWPHAKLIVTVRPTAFPKHTALKLFGFNQRVCLRYVLPFSTKQLLDHLQLHLQFNATERQQFAQLLQELPELREQLRIPVVLKLLINAWARLKGKDLRQLNRFQIYDNNMRHAIESQQARLAPSVQATLREGYADLVSSFFASGEFLAALGFAENQPSIPRAHAIQNMPPALRGWVNLKTLVAEDARQTFRSKRQGLEAKKQYRAILSEEDFVQMQLSLLSEFLQNLPFKFDSANHDYIHRSLYEFLMARALISGLHLAASHQQDHKPLTKMLLGQPIQSEPAIFGFFCEEFCAQSDKTQQLWQQPLKQVIDDSRTSPATGQASANAATLLNGCGVPLDNLDCSGVQLAGADLSYGFFANTNFKEANLQGATLQHAVLRNANLKKANLRKVRWGETAYFKYEKSYIPDDMTRIVRHPTEPFMAIAKYGLNTEAQTEDSRTKKSKRLSIHDLIIIDATSGKQIGQAFPIEEKDYILGIAFSPDGQMIAARYLSNITFWDWNTHRRLGSITINSTEMIFSADSQHIVSVSEDKSVRLWDVHTRQAVGSTMNGQCVAVSPDAQFLASVNDNTVFLWDMQTQKPIGKPMTGHTDVVKCVTFSSDNKLIASASQDKTVCIWDLSTQQKLGTPMEHLVTVQKIAFSPNNQLIAAASGITLYLWNIRTRQRVGIPRTGHTQNISSIEFSRDGQQIISWSLGDSFIRFWDITSQTLITPHAKHMAGVEIVFSPDGQYFVTTSYSGTMYLWNSDTRKTLGKPMRGAIAAFDLSGKQMISAQGNILYLWEVSTQKLIHSFATDRNVEGVIFSPKGDLLVRTTENDVLEFTVDWLYPEATATPRKYSLNSLAGQYNSNLYSLKPDSKYIALASGDLLLKWHIVRNMLAQPEKVTSDDEIFDFNRLAKLNKEKQDEIITKKLDQLDKEKEEKAKAKQTMNEAVWHSENGAIALKPDGKQLFCGTRYDEISLWDIATQKQIVKLRGHLDRIICMAFDPSGQYIISGSEDKTIRLWDTATRRCRSIMHWDHAIRSLAFRPLPPKSAAEEKVNSSLVGTLVLGDRAGVVSFWEVRKDGSLALIDMPKHPAASLLVEGAQFQRSQMSAASYSLLKQRGANVDNVVLIEEGSASASASSFFRFFKRRPDESKDRFAQSNAAEPSPSLDPVAGPPHSSSSQATKGGLFPAARPPHPSSSLASHALSAAATPASVAVFE